MAAPKADGVALALQRLGLVGSVSRPMLDVLGRAVLRRMSWGLITGVPLMCRMRGLLLLLLLLPLQLARSL